MSSLNDDFEDDLVANLAGEINPDQPIPPKMSLFASENGLPTYKLGDNAKDIVPEDLFGEGLVKGELPNVDAKITVLADKTNELIDQETLARDVVQPCTMCRSSFETIQEVVTDFKTPDLFTAMYTEQPTKVNFQQTVARLDKVFAENQVQIQTDLNNVISSSAQLISNRAAAIPFDTAETFDLKRKWLDLTVAKIDERSDALDTPVGTGKFTLLDFDSSESLHRCMEMLNSYIQRSYDLEHLKNADDQTIRSFTPEHILTIQSVGSSSFPLRKLVEMIKSQDYFVLLQERKEEIETAITRLKQHLLMNVASPSLPKFREMASVLTITFFEIEEAMYLADVVCLFKAFEETLMTTLAVLTEL